MTYYGTFNIPMRRPPLRFAETARGWLHRVATNVCGPETTVSTGFLVGELATEIRVERNGRSIAWLTDTSLDDTDGRRDFWLHLWAGKPALEVLA